MLHENIQKMMTGVDLTEVEMMESMTKIMSGEITESQMASFLTALKMKGESVAEIVGGARVMREKADRLELQNFYTVDTCGTGGDHFGTFNISTATAIVTAAAGVKVVKHGNRSVSSKCGSADVLEALGARIDLTKEQVGSCVEQEGIGFFFAPLFHQAMKHVGKTRKELGFRTIFNILGPLANPANANAQVLGVFDEKLLEPMANVLLNLGVERAMVVHGREGLDEISISGETDVVEIKDGKLTRYVISPETFGLEKADIETIKGGGAVENAQIIRDIFQGEMGPKKDILLLNAGAALYVGKKVDTLAEGVALAKDMIDSGKALEKLNSFVQLTRTIE